MRERTHKAIIGGLLISLTLITLMGERIRETIKEKFIMEENISDFQYFTVTFEDDKDDKDDKDDVIKKEREIKHKISVNIISKYSKYLTTPELEALAVKEGAFLRDLDELIGKHECK